ncbi:EpsG family protein [Alistipes shahii]|uniref:EpsG family protein n=1 Tax=Alistipes shahii TaxID=328814 RepID=UPI0014599D45|nr:EpsG family protein [Alistipes shahii]NMF24786.1 EpsG family protein [Alistipes shahii]
MEIQLLVLVLALLGAWYYSSLPASTPIRENRNRKNYIIFVCIILILQSALRHVAVGADTYAYYLKFEEIKLTSWQEIWENFRSVYVLGEGKDAGYPLIQKVFQLFSEEYRIFLFFVAVIFFSSLGYFIYTQTKHISDVFVAIAIYEVLFYSFFSITGLRQTLATAFTFWGLHFIRQRKLWQYTLLLICAAFIHKSVLLFYPFYFIARLNRPRQLLSASFVIFPFMFVFGRSVAGIMALLSAQDNYMGYALSEANPTGAVDFSIFLLGCGILGWIALRNAKQRDNDMPIIYNAISIAIIFTPLTWIDSSLMRIVQYFSIFILVFLPYVINNLFRDYQTRTVVILVLTILFVTVIIMRNVDYAFMWEQMQLDSNYL